MRLRPASLFAALCAAFLPPTATYAADQVRQIGVFVKPYYEAGRNFSEAPKVAVDPAWDKLLMSGDRATIAKVRDAIAASPDQVKPTTLMVLAIRLYDVGLRDDAVSWFYVARDRYATMDAVLDMRSLVLAGTAQAMDAFVAAVGPAINGYAFCDVARQQAHEADAVKWVAAHPYRLLESTDLPTRDDDRNAALGRALEDMRQEGVHQQQFLANPANLAEMKALRAHNDADARFCWK